MKMYKKCTAIMAAVVLSTGCATVETESWQNCAIAGALLGGAAGAFVEASGEAAVGAVTGGAIGGLICGNTAEPAAVAPPAPDSDNDGVADTHDACPDTPTGTTVDSKGCTLDGDADGVVDDKDQCPNSAPGAKVNELGCVNPLVLKGVNFHLNSAELTEQAKSILGPIADDYRDNHGDLNLLIGGHTDSQGTNAYNMDLSQRRAESVRRFMVAKGCDANKLTAVGHGEEKPIADNSNKEGRAKNRRVEISVK